MTDSIESMQQQGRLIEVPDSVRERAYLKSREEYDAMYKRSVEDPEGFWAEQADEYLYWHKKWDKVLEWEFDTPKIEWFKGGQDERRLQLPRPASHRRGAATRPR